MNKTKIRIVKLGEDDSNVKYWVTRTKVERLIELQQMRDQIHKWKYGTFGERIQRVYRIIKQV